MERKRSFTTIVLTALAVMMIQAQEVKVPLRFDFYYSYEQVVDALKALNKAYPELTSLDQVGKSEEGRIIWALTINNPKTGDPMSKPGVYADGNIHGNEIQAGEVCLYLANRLLTNYGKLKEITEVVDRNAFYIIPVVNVDGRAHFFEDANTPSTNRGLRIPMDDDRDGLFDEDGPDDLDGDGNISTMRIRDTLGRYRSDPEDPRLMVAVKPGEKGEWTRLGQEGIDNDGDGQVNEDGEGYVDGNRNWGFNWQPPYVQRGAGNYPFEGTGIRAVAEWMLARQNIILVFAFHNNGGMYLRGPSFKAAGELPQGDIAVYNYLGENIEKIVPGYEYLISWKDLYSTYGDFTDFTNNLVGSYSMVGELFQARTETFDGSFRRKEEEGRSRFGEASESERQRLHFNDRVTQGELYNEWKPFKHPLYGDIELGGWVKMSSRLPHTFMLQDLVHRNASAVIFAARNTPRITMDVFEVKKLSGNLWSVRVRLVNEGAMPSVTYETLKNKLYPPDVLSVSGRNAKVIGGGQLTDIYTGKVDYKEHKPQVQLCQVPGLGKIEYQFLVSGRGDVDIKFESRKTGTVSKTVALK
ncbi:MAG: M14 family metallopeptidase [Bacteroidales bacterium]|nr:M14 family metallopeptidase [Bacteroidales bacterium]MDT8372400.1 M14 family metallopeptidase [Bacteroidales bacterium]